MRCSVAFAADGVAERPVVVVAVGEVAVVEAGVAVGGVEEDARSNCHRHWPQFSATGVDPARQKPSVNETGYGLDVL